jgi:hypothetical protein
MHFGALFVRHPVRPPRVTRLRAVLAGFVVAFAALCATAGLSRAATIAVDCTSNSAALATQFESGVPSGSTVTVLGTCIGTVTVGSSFVTIEQAGGGGEIQGTVGIFTQGVTISGITIDGHGATQAGIVFESGAYFSTLNDVTVQNFPNSGVTMCCTAISVLITGGTFQTNVNCGIFAIGAGDGFTLSNDGGGNPPVITGNGTTANPGQPQGGVCLQDGAIAEITAATVQANGLGPALSIIGAAANVTGGSFASPAALTFPTVELQNSKLNLLNATITGTGSSNAIFASPGGSITMQNTTVTQSDVDDATVLIADDSALVSLGGNHITNSGAGGIAIMVDNLGTFHQRNETAFGIPVAADIITGVGIVQVQSDMEIGTGAGAASSTWTGNITVQQNSSFRMDGGMSISGGVAIIQGSNGFFNKSAGGTNSVAVTCAGSSSHIAGPGNVSPAVTLVASGVGCYSF